MQDGRSRPDSILCLWGIYESSLRFTLSLESFVRYSCVPVARACTSWPNPAMVLHPPRLMTIIKPMMNSTIQCPIVRGSASRNLSVRLAIFLACFFILKSISLCVCVMSREFYKLEQHSDLWMTNYYLAVSFSCSSIYSSTSASIIRQRSSSFSFISSSKVRSSIRLLQFIRKSRQGDRGWFVRRKYT